jgi:hypothetical protein
MKGTTITMSTLLSRRGARRVAVAAVSLVGASLALLPAAPSQAVVTGTVTSGAVQWKISDYLASDTFGRPTPLPSAYLAPASFDTTARSSTWGGGSATSLATDGSAVTAFQGTSVNYTTTSGGWLRLKGVKVNVDSSGNGMLTAEVSYGTSANAYDPASVPVRGPESINVMVLSGNTSAKFSSTPAQATWAGLTGSWSPDLLDFVDGDSAATPAIPAWSHASAFNVASGAVRAPAPVTFTLDRVTPSVAVTTTKTDPTTGVTLAVTGDGFRGVTQSTPPPADNGVYVGLAPAGTMPDVSSMAGMAAFAASSYIPAAAMTSGAISASLTAPPEKLDPTKSYAIYTWQAHTHSNTSQDTQTPVTIDWAALVKPATPAAKQASAVLASFNKAPKANKKADFAVSVSGGSVTPTGTVTVTLVRKGTSKTTSVSSALVGGAALFQLPKFKPGKWTLTTTYSGDSGLNASQTTTTVKIKKIKKAKKK